jgi:hypothetical protein
MTTFRAARPLLELSPQYVAGYRYVIATAEVTIPAGVVDAVNGAAGGAVSGSVTLNTVTYTVARTLAEGETNSEVIGTVNPASTETAAFKAVIPGQTDGRRVVTFDKTLTPTGEASGYAFHFVHYGLVGNVFVAEAEVEIDDGALTGPGGLAARYYSNRSLTGLPTVEAVENVNLTRSTTVSGINMEDFSARWVGYIRIPAAGAYRFRLASDGRGRMTLGQQLYIDDWGDNERRVSTGPSKTYTTNEDVFLLVEMANPRLGHECVLSWETPSTPGVFNVVPASVLFYGANATLPTPRQSGATHYVQSINRYEES